MERERYGRGKAEKKTEDIIKKIKKKRKSDMEVSTEARKQEQVRILIIF